MARVNLWRESSKGFKSRFTAGAKRPVPEREDLQDLVVATKVKRGDMLQRIRLKRVPSIDVDREELYAGEVEGDLDEATDRLSTLGFRNNPTAYVEVTEENGPDDGSYSRTIITETGGGFDRPMAVNRPTILRRVKEQIHVVVYELPDKVEYLVHRETSAWLQPARHTLVNKSSARRGVRDFRDIWYDEFGEELGGKEDVRWDTTH